MDAATIRRRLNPIECNAVLLRARSLAGGASEDMAIRHVASDLRVDTDEVHRLLGEAQRKLRGLGALPGGDPVSQNGDNPAAPEKAEVTERPPTQADWRDRVLALIGERGPISQVQMAAILHSSSSNLRQQAIKPLLEEKLIAQVGAENRSPIYDLAERAEQGEGTAVPEVEPEAPAEDAPAVPQSHVEPPKPDDEDWPDTAERGDDPETEPEESRGDLEPPQPGDPGLPSDPDALAELKRELADLHEAVEGIDAYIAQWPEPTPEPSLREEYVRMLMRLAEGRWVSPDGRWVNPDWWAQRIEGQLDILERVAVEQ